VAVRVHAQAPLKEGVAGRTDERTFTNVAGLRRGNDAKRVEMNA
jgi:hypothetical protein